MSEVKSATRVMQILNLLQSQPLGLPAAEISTALDLPKSSTHELLHSMTTEKYLQQKKNRYSLGLKVFEIGQAAARNSELLQHARPILRWVGGQLNEAVYLAVLDDTEVVYLSKIQFRTDVRFKSQVGARLPAQATGLGKAILSKIAKEEVRNRFSQNSFKTFTANTITTLDGLERELEQTRANGYAVDRGEYTNGIFCYAMPVMDSQNQVLAAIGVALPNEPESPTHRSRILDLLTEATGNLSQKFGVKSGNLAGSRH